MTKATMTEYAKNFSAAIRGDDELQTRRRITYEVTSMQGLGRAAGGSQIVALAFSDGNPIFPISLVIPLPRVRKAGEWLGFLHDEVNRLLAVPMKRPASATTPRKR